MVIKRQRPTNALPVRAPAITSRINTYRTIYIYIYTYISEINVATKQSFGCLLSKLRFSYHKIYFSPESNTKRFRISLAYLWCFDICAVGLVITFLNLSFVKVWTFDTYDDQYASFSQSIHHYLLLMYLNRTTCIVRSYDNMMFTKICCNGKTLEVQLTMH